MPADASLKVAEEPRQIVAAPVIAAGTGFTVIVFVRLQPDAILYEIVAVLALTPVTMPVEEPTVATPGLLLVHAPPVVALLS